MTDTKLRERPILFNAAMVRAILAGRKTQTRRVVKPQPVMAVMDGNAADALIAATNAGLVPRQPKPYWRWNGCHHIPWPKAVTCLCPYGVPGDRLWVREAHAINPKLPASMHTAETALDRHVRYRADGGEPWNSWRPSIHMPRWASRILLEVTDVRVERVGEISPKDIMAEGAVLRSHDVDAFAIVGGNPKCPVSAFDGCVYPDLKSLWASGWDSINAKRGYGWADNPWVWAVTFRVLEGGADHD